MKECETMVDLAHPGLVQLAGVALQQKPWLCVIEYMEYGDLKNVLQTCKEKNFEVTYREQLHISIQISSGLAFMASKRYIHMDIAARNCLLSKGNQAKVADFGLVRLLPCNCF